MLTALLMSVLASNGAILAAHSLEEAEVLPGPPFLSTSTMGVGIVLSSLVGFAYAAFWAWRLSDIVIDPSKERFRTSEHLTTDVLRQVFIISERVSSGAMAFLAAEYRYMGVFMFLFAALLYCLLGSSLSSNGIVSTPWLNALLSTVCFLMGVKTSVFSGWIGMRIAVYANSRTAVKATDGADEGDYGRGFTEAFKTAFRGGITMGFALTSAGVLSLFATCCFVFYVLGVNAPMSQVAECVAAFGLGGSSVACFGRVGGGIFTKAADVGADLVGKIEKNIPEDDARNPGVIADCIGDNVGDIAGMGSDLFGSFGEATCAGFVLAASSPQLSNYLTSMLYPLAVTSVGVLVCIFVSFYAATRAKIENSSHIEPILKRQLVYATIGSSILVTVLSYLALPTYFVVSGVHATRLSALVCVLAGIWSGLFIGFTTEYFTSHAFYPVRELAEACETGAATNIIYGLSLGYRSVIPTTFAIAATIYISFHMAGLFGYALAALGILTTMAVGLTIDAYGPIADNAGGFAEMAQMGQEVRIITDALDSAGNTTAAIGKGFAISSAAFVALALYGAYVTRVDLVSINILDSRVMPGLVIGGMLPFWFTSLTMKSVGVAAMEMVNEIRRQFTDPAVAEGTREPDYDACVSIATQAALREMVAPAMLVMLSPIVIGVLFGKYAVAGLLPGALVSGVQLAVASSNTGGAWDNAKKYIEQGGLGSEKGKGSPQHAAAVIGDTVGDPLKDTSGPSLNILVKLMAIISVVFAPVIESAVGGILLRILGDPSANV